MIIVKIDVTKIDKTKLFKGTKGTYLDIILMPAKGGEDNFGNSHMAIQGVTKEERDAGVKGNILGNAKTIQTRTDRPKPKERDTSHEVPTNSETEEEDDIPF